MKNKCCKEDYCTCYSEGSTIPELSIQSTSPKFDLERLQMRLECLKLASKFTDPNGDGVYAIELANRYYDYLTK